MASAPAGSALLGIAMDKLLHPGDGRSPATPTRLRRRAAVAGPDLGLRLEAAPEAHLGSSGFCGPCQCRTAATQKVWRWFPRGCGGRRDLLVAWLPSVLSIPTESFADKHLPWLTCGSSTSVLWARVPGLHAIDGRSSPAAGCPLLLHSCCAPAAWRWKHNSSGAFRRLAACSRGDPCSCCALADHGGTSGVVNLSGGVGLELLLCLQPGSGYFVWDPITNSRWGVPPPPVYLDSWNVAVLCAKEHCDHLGCHGPPFLVAMAGSDLESQTTSACVYSSESGLWSDIIALKHRDYIDSDGRSILVGNTVHFPFAESYSVLQYELGEQKLSVIHVPDKNWDDESLVFISAKDGVLEFAGWRGTNLSLWSTEAGALAWTQRLVILGKLLPARAFESILEDEDGFEPFVAAFAEGAIFLSTMAGLFTVDLNSGRTKKVAKVEFAFNVTPWTSFYTLDHARHLRPLP